MSRCYIAHKLRSGDLSQYSCLLRDRSFVSRVWPWVLSWRLALLFLDLLRRFPLLLLLAARSDDLLGSDTPTRLLVRLRLPHSVLAGELPVQRRSQADQWLAAYLTRSGGASLTLHLLLDVPLGGELLSGTLLPTAVDIGALVQGRLVIAAHQLDEVDQLLQVGFLLPAELARPFEAANLRHESLLGFDPAQLVLL